MVSNIDYEILRKPLLIPVILPGLFTASAIKMNKTNRKGNLTKFYEGLVPLYVICRAAGIFPLRARRRDGEILMEVKRSDIIYFFVYFGGYAVLSVYSIYFLYLNKEEFNIVPHLVVFAESVIVVGLMFITIFFCFWFRKLLLDCVRLLSDVDSAFPGLDININYSTAKGNNLKVFGIMLASVTVRSLVTIFSVNVDFIQQITLFMATFIKSLSKYQFIAMLLPIAVRFDKINSTIVSYIENGHVTEKLAGNLYTLCRLHFKLCNISRLLNACFAFQLLSSLGVSLADILFHSFYLYTISTKKNIVATWAMFGSPVIWLIDECLEIYLLVRACAGTCETANNTVIRLHELRNNAKKNEADKHVQMYSLQMLHQKLEFSALGFFNIDYCLLYSILGAVTTYLVIFIQFDQSQGTKEGLLVSFGTDNCTSLQKL